MRLRTAVIFALFALTVASCGREESKKGTALPMPKGTAQRPAGMPAITVSPGASPPFSQDDVAAYIRTNGLPKGTEPAASLQVDSLEFVRSDEVPKRLDGASTGLGDAEMVGFATISGPIVFSGPPPAREPVRFSRGYAIFDATNGNLLMFGSLPER